MALASNQIDSPKKPRHEQSHHNGVRTSVSPRGPPKKDKMWKIKVPCDDFLSENILSPTCSRSLKISSEAVLHGKMAKVENSALHHDNFVDIKEPISHHVANRKLITTNRHSPSPTKKSEKYPRKGPRTPPDTPPRTPSISPERPPTPHTPVSVYSHHQSPLSSISSIGCHRTPSPANYCATPEYPVNSVGVSRLPLTLGSRSRSPSPYSSRASSTDSRSESHSTRSGFGAPSNKSKMDGRYNQEYSKSHAKNKSNTESKHSRKILEKKVEQEETHPTAKETTIKGQPLPLNFPQAEQPRMSASLTPQPTLQQLNQPTIQTQVPIQQTALGTLQVQSQVQVALPTYVTNPMAGYPGQPLGNILIHNQTQHSVQVPPQIPVTHQVPVQHQVLMQHTVPVQHPVIMSQQQQQMPVMHQAMATQVLTTQQPPPLPPVPPPPPPPPMMVPSSSNQIHISSRGNYSTHQIKIQPTATQQSQVIANSNGGGANLLPMMVNFSVPPPNYNIPPNNSNLQIAPPNSANQPAIANLSVPPPGHVPGGMVHQTVPPSGCNFNVPPPPINHHQAPPQPLLPPPVDIQQNVPSASTLPPPNIPLQRSMMARPQTNHHSQPPMHPPPQTTHHHGHIPNNQYQSHMHHGTQHSRLQSPHHPQMQQNYDRMNNHYSQPHMDPLDGRMSNSNQRMDYRMMNAPRTHRQYEPHMGGRNRHSGLYHQK